MNDRYDGKEVPPSITTTGASLPKWAISDPDKEMLFKALAMAIEGLEAIAKHQQTLIKDSGMSMSTTYTIAKRALAKIERMGD